jgi:fatty acid synthase subunit beta
LLLSLLLLVDDRHDETPAEIHKIIQCYTAVLAELKQMDHASDVAAPLIGVTSGLFEMAKKGAVGLFALFGGQGVNWLQELRTNYQVYVDVRPTIEKAIVALQKQATLLLEGEEEAPSAKAGSDSGVKGYNELFNHGLNVLEWITDDSNVPPSTYLSSAPVSYPMIGLTALINYLVCIKTWNLSPSEVVSHFKGVTGTILLILRRSSCFSQRLSGAVCAVLTRPTSS